MLLYDQGTKGGRIVSKKKAAKAKTARGIRNLPAKTLTAKNARNVKAGKAQNADGSLDAGIHFKYDIKAQKNFRTR